MTTEEENNSKSKKKKIILIGLGTAAAGVAGFFGWEWWQGRKAKKEEENIQSNSAGSSHSKYGEEAPSKHGSSHASSSGSGDFPLHKGSHGAKVKAMQEALIAKYGATILPKYGADGGFGNEMVAALKTAGLPSTIDESTFNSFTGNSSSSSGSNSSGAGSSSKMSDAEATKRANDLHDAVTKPDFAATLSLLKQLNDPNQYASVDAVYKNISSTFWGGGKKTIVTGTLEAFTDDSQQKQLSDEFSRMGLKLDNGKWTIPLAGFEMHPLVIAKKETEVFEKGGRKHVVPEGTILGYPYAVKEEWIYFYSIQHPILLRVHKATVNIKKSNL